MSPLEIFLTAFSLSLDAVAVSIAAGALRPTPLRHALRASFFFGAFQAIMPFLGLVLGIGFRSYLVTYGNLIGFFVLAALGIKMLIESLKPEDPEVEEQEKHIAHLPVLTTLAFFTSIDALIVGVSFNFLTVNISFASATIGLVTFLLCLTGFTVGKHTRHLIGNRIEILGALILIGLACKMLFY